MFEINPDRRFTTEEKLLFNIMQQNNEILKILSKPIEEKPKQEPKPCQYCGGTHDNVGQRLACAKKNKKKEESQNE